MNAVRDPGAMTAFPPDRIEALREALAGHRCLYPRHDHRDNSRCPKSLPALRSLLLEALEEIERGRAAITTALRAYLRDLPDDHVVAWEAGLTVLGQRPVTAVELRASLEQDDSGVAARYEARILEAACAYLAYRTDHESRAKVAVVSIELHPFVAAWDDYEDGIPGRCSFPLCTLPPELHEPADPHECDEHPQRAGFCLTCGRALPALVGEPGQ